MQFSSNILILVVVVCFGRAEVQLIQGINSTVNFEGDELIIKVDNPQVRDLPLILCFGSIPNTVYLSCPNGYAGISVNVHERTETFKLDRHGKLSGTIENYQIRKEVVFNPDGSVNVLVPQTPSGITVSLPNANLPVGTTTASTPGKKAATTNATLRIVFVVVLVILLLIVIGAVLLYCCWYKKRNQSNQVRRTRDKTREADESLPQTVVKSDVQPPPKRPASVPKTAPKRTSTSTTKASDEKQIVVIAPKPTPATSVRSPFDSASILSAPTTTIGARQKSNPSKKSRRRTFTTPTHGERSTEPSRISQDHGDSSVTNSHSEMSQYRK
uniref:Uncharacterized protein n=1 Tax=Panagrellus redivivus TaxID=6233 RepID=A0A7E4ZX55_PANRE